LLVTKWIYGIIHRYVLHCMLVTNQCYLISSRHMYIMYVTLLAYQECNPCKKYSSNNTYKLSFRGPDLAYIQKSRPKVAAAVVVVAVVSNVINSGACKTLYSIILNTISTSFTNTYTLKINLRNTIITNIVGSN